MDVYLRYLVAICLLLSAAAFAWRLKAMIARPNKRDLSRPRGSRGAGVLYAFTLGMAPWEKESTRLHWVSYIRGVVFHVGIFAALAVLVLSLLTKLDGIAWALALLLTLAGGTAGVLGVAMRSLDASSRALSVPDDYMAVSDVSIFVLLAAAALLNERLLPIFWLWSSFTLLYIPFSKVRHGFYFFYAKFFFGAGFGQRGVLPPRRNEVTR